jgi:hypothetical protein
MLLCSSRGFPPELFRAHIYSSVIFGGSIILTDAVVAVEGYHTNYYRRPHKSFGKDAAAFVRWDHSERDAARVTIGTYL